MAVSSSSRVPVPDTEFAFTWEDFQEIAALVHSDSGIVLGESKANLVYSRLAKRLRACGLRSFHDYCALVKSEDGIDERQAMIAAMTTNVTRFFREDHHFAYLRTAVLPHLAEKARSGQPIRIWSAGCSSGEEPYSIAITMAEAIPDLFDLDVLILASDLDPNMIRRAQAAVYAPAQLDNVPAELRTKWFQRTERDGEPAYIVSEKLRKIIRFRELNLLGAWPMKRPFDVIFCRNVMIYFDEPTQDSIWSRYARQLVPSGMLFIGHSERIATERHPFTLVSQTAYRLKAHA